LLPGAIHRELLRLAEEDDRIIMAAARLEMTGQIDTGDSYNIFVAKGIVPSNEEQFFKESKTLKRGFSFIAEGERLRDEEPNEIGIAFGVRRTLGLNLESDAVLMTRTIDGQINVVDARVKNIFAAPNSSLDNKLIKMPLELAQDLYQTDSVGAVGILLHHPRDIPAVAKLIKDRLDQLDLSAPLPPEPIVSSPPPPPSVDPSPRIEPEGEEDDVQELKVRVVSEPRSALYGPVDAESPSPPAGNLDLYQPPPAETPLPSSSSLYEEAPETEESFRNSLYGSDEEATPSSEVTLDRDALYAEPSGDEAEHFAQVDAILEQVDVDPSPGKEQPEALIRESVAPPIEETAAPAMAPIAVQAEPPLPTTPQPEIRISRWDEESDTYKLTRKMFDMIFGMVFIILIIIVSMSVMNTMGMAIMERTTEIGTLRAMGLKRTGVVRLFAMEGAVLGLLGSFLGAIATFTVWLFVLVAKPMWTPPTLGREVPLEIHLVLSYLLMTSVFLVVLTWVAAVLPARRAAKQGIVEALGHV
ncbi:MAG: FtsX-like permease family protein, partial [Verrucomicrobiota bacterium]